MKTLLTLLLTIGVCVAEPVKFEELNGYTKVTVTKVLGDGIRIIHSNGARMIPADELSPELKARFGIDASSIAESAKDKELSKRAALRVLGLRDYGTEIEKRLLKLKNPAKLSDEEKTLLKKEIVLLKQRRYRAIIVPKRPVIAPNDEVDGNPAKIRPVPAKPKKDPFKRKKRGLDSNFDLKK